MLATDLIVGGPSSLPQPTAAIAVSNLISHRPWTCDAHERKMLPTLSRRPATGSHEVGALAGAGVLRCGCCSPGAGPAAGGAAGPPQRSSATLYILYIVLARS